LDFPAGIERAIVNTANLASDKGNKVSIVILDKTEKIFFLLNSSVSVHRYELDFGIGSKGNPLKNKIAFLSHLRILKRNLKELSPDIVIATEYPFSIAARMVLKKGTKLYSWEHHHFYHLKRSRFWQTLFKRYYPKIDKIICLNEDEGKLFQQIGCKTFVIPNFTSFSSNRKSTLNQKQILTVGWFTKTKGTDLIPSIAEKVFKRHPDWKWKIIGQGKEASSLKAFPNLELSGPVSNIEEEYLNSSIYVLPSRFECFPMVLLEAMSFGLPCIAFDCPTGPRHIVTNGEDGILVEKENIEAIARAIMELMENEEKRKRMGSKAFENIQRFSPENVYQLWEKLFNDKNF